MNHCWINQKHNPTCILFFNGWGMDEQATAHLSTEDRDVCMLNRYHTLTPLPRTIAGYPEVVVIAWSLGIWAAEAVLTQSDITAHRSLAINGTACPVHDAWGIPTRIFEASLHTWDDDARKKFERRMYGTEEPGFERYNARRSTADQKAELEALYTLIRQRKPAPMHWHTALTGRYDRIFPFRNQSNWWANKTRHLVVDQPHFPFHGLERWSQLTDRLS